ncbi:MAG: hypothetical protein QM523_11180 [Candidatus Pacebacteria bacterium]|nr:hypothetical protein [Candidatus Paceibacterota bacterium]
MHNCQIIQIPVAHLVAVWPQVEPHLRAALDYCHGCWEPVDILSELMQGQGQLWIAWQPAELAQDSRPNLGDGGQVLAAMVTRIITYPRKKSCQVFLIGGKGMRHWSQAFLTAVESYARSQSCHFLEGGARRGWMRVGGFYNNGVTLTKELNYGQIDISTTDTGTNQFRD